MPSNDHAELPRVAPAEEPLGGHLDAVVSRHGYDILALAIYAILALVFFGRPLRGCFLTAFIGKGGDPAISIWSLAWWPHALVSRVNPFLSHSIWAPQGINLAWRTSIPLLSAFAYPITRMYGPIAAHNVLCILSPTLGAWTAFILLRYLTERYVPALAGGYVFGFSAYLVAHQAFGQVVLTMVCLIPLAVYLILLKFNGQIATKRFIVEFGILIAAQSLVSLEIAASLTMFVAIAWGLALAMSEGAFRQRIYRVLIPVISGYGLAAILLSPLLYFLFAYGAPKGPIWPPAAMSVDLLNLVIPARTNLLGSLAVFARVTARFHLNPGEQDAYFGVPLIAVAAHYGYRNWRDLRARLLILMTLITSVLALGPRLRALGWIGFGLPWKLFLHFPFIDKAAPSRFSMYAFLALAAIFSLWLKDSSINQNLRATCAIAVIFCQIPDLSSAHWVERVRSPEFFSSEMYRSYLHLDENLLILPYAGQNMIWQAQTNMHFRMVNGQFGPPPPEREQWPISVAFDTMTDIPGEAKQLRAFLAAHDVDSVVVDNADRDVGFWQSLAAGLQVKPTDAGGVSLFRVSPADLSAYRNVSAVQMEQTFDHDRFDTLLRAANDYLLSGHALSALTPRAVQELGLLPPKWVRDDDVRTSNGLWLGPWTDGRVSVGIDGSLEALRPIIQRYKPDASVVYFPFPRQLGAAPGVDNSAIRLLVMVFNRDGLSAAAALSGR